MKKLKYILASLVMVGLMATVFTPVVNGASVISDVCTGSQATENVLCQHQNDDLMSWLKPVINTVLTILGVLAVVMIIYAGITYTLSAGDAKKVEQAKNTIIYSVVGLIVAVLAGVIVNFVLNIFI